MQQAIKAAANHNHPLQLLKKELTEELDNILNWWLQYMVDSHNGGFYGRIDGRGKLHPLADKSVILNTRILWTFSMAAQFDAARTDWRMLADRAFEYLLHYFWDRKEGGVFWMLDCYGVPSQDKKQIYAQAFTIYALATYYELTQNREALEKAKETFWLIEQYSHDELHGGYFEAFARNWNVINDLRLSEKDANEAKTMNTQLHILEAYTALYRIMPTAEVRLALRSLAQLFIEKFIDPDTHHLQLFFDENWQLKSDEISFGHDIECSWLLCEAAAVLNDEIFQAEIQKKAVAIAGRTLAEGIDRDGGIFNTADSKGLTNRDKDWWPQAEAVVGFFNAWQITGKECFLKTAINSWHFIQSYLLDDVNGEWFWAIYADGTPDVINDKAGPWKCPYHNSRMIYEIIKRLEK